MASPIRVSRCRPRRSDRHRLAVAAPTTMTVLPSACSLSIVPAARHRHRRPLVEPLGLAHPDPSTPRSRASTPEPPGALKSSGSASRARGFCGFARWPCPKGARSLVPRRRPAQQIVLPPHGSRGHQIDHRRLALGDGAGFVEHDGVQLGGGLQGFGFLNRMPFSAPLPVPAMMAVGVASPRAQGQAMTSTATSRIMAGTNAPVTPPPDTEGHQAMRDHGRHEHGRHPVGQPPGWGPCCPGPPAPGG